MGFEKILNHLKNKDLHIVLLSKVFPPEFEIFSRTYFRDPAFIYTGVGGEPTYNRISSE